MNKNKYYQPYKDTITRKASRGLIARYTGMTLIMLALSFITTTQIFAKSDGIANNIKDMNLLTTELAALMYDNWEDSALNFTEEFDNKIIKDNTGSGMIFDKCTINNNSGQVRCITNSTENVHHSLLGSELFIQPFFLDEARDRFAFAARAADGDSSQGVHDSKRTIDGFLCALFAPKFQGSLDVMSATSRGKSDKKQKKQNNIDPSTKEVTPSIFKLVLKTGFLRPCKTYKKDPPDKPGFPLKARK